MTINSGQVEMVVSFGNEPDAFIKVTVEYDTVLTGGEVVPENQPIVNRNGAAVRIENTSTQTAIVRLTGPTGTRLLDEDGEADFKIRPGLLTFTANQLRQQTGIETRHDIGEFSLSSP